MRENESPFVRYLRDPSLLLKDGLELAREALGIALQLAPVAAATRSRPGLLRPRS